MATNAVYVDGQSALPQARPTSAVSPAYVDGQSGPLPILAYVAPAGGLSIPVAMHHYLHTLGR